MTPMKFTKAIYKREIVFLINSETIDNSLMEDIIKNISPDTKTGFDMGAVKTIKSSLFIEYLLSNKIKLFNLSGEVLAYLSLILKEGFLKSYINYSDFKDNKRELIRRRFSAA